MPIRRSALLLAMTLLAGCSIGQSRTAHTARTRLLGATAPEIDACAGTPDHIEQFGPRSEFRTYAHDTSADSGFSITLPVIGGVSLGGGGYCRATFQMQDGRVTALRYAGDKDALLAPDALCAPLIKSCVKEIQSLHSLDTARSGNASMPVRHTDGNAIGWRNQYDTP